MIELARRCGESGSWLNAVAGIGIAAVVMLLLWGAVALWEKADEERES